MDLRRLLPAVASVAIAVTAAGAVCPVRAQDATASVLAERAELDKALAAETDARIPLLEKFIAEHPQSLLIEQAREALVRTHATVGEVGLKNGDPRAASAAFTRALEAAGDTISDRLFKNVIWQMPLVMASAGFRTDSIELMKSFEPRFQSDAPRLIQIGYFYVSIQSPHDAVRVLERAVAVAPDDHRAHNTLGTAYVISLRLDDAANEFARAIELDAKEEFAYASLANLRRAFGNSTEAVELYKKQLEIKSDDPETYGNLAVAHLLNDDDASAAQALARALALRPDNFRLYTTLGYYYVSRGMYDKAREMADLSLRYEPRFAWTHVVRGNVLLGQKRYAEAVQALSEAQSYGDFPTLHFELAKAHMVNDQFEQALEQLQAAFDITDDGQFETRLGDVLDLRSSKLELLLERERRAVLFMPVQPTTETQYRLAESLARIGHFLELIPDAATGARVESPKPAAPAAVEPASVEPEPTAPTSPLLPEVLPEPAPETSEPPAPAEDEDPPPYARFVRRVVFQQPAPAGSGRIVTTDPELKPADAPLVFRPRRAAPRPEPAAGTAPDTAVELTSDPASDPAAGTAPATDVPPTSAPAVAEAAPAFDPNGPAVDPEVRERLVAAIDAFVGVDDGREAFRKMWVARKLADKGVMLDKAKELAEQALAQAPASVEQDRSLRDMPDADLETRKAVLTARAQDALGWVLLKRREMDEAIAQLTRSVQGAAADPEVSSRIWHLGVAKQETGAEQEALDLYVRAYDPASPAAPIRRRIIEQLYTKLHGSTEGLDARLARP
jgi:tetratricopeptide (TPR) repeat protein